MYSLRDLGMAPIHETLKLYRAFLRAGEYNACVADCMHVGSFVRL